MALSHALRALVAASLAHLQAGAQRFNLTLLHSLVLSCLLCAGGVLRLRLHKTSLGWEIAPRRGRQRSDLRKEVIVL